MLKYFIFLAILIFGGTASTRAQIVSDPVVEYFKVKTQSAGYAGDQDHDNAPDFVVNRTVEFELLACDPDGGALAGTVTFGAGAQRVLNDIPCDRLSFPYTFKEPEQDLIVVLDVLNAVGRSQVSALKLDIVEADAIYSAEATESLSPPEIGPLEKVGAAALAPLARAPVTRRIVDQGIEKVPVDPIKPKPSDQTAQAGASSSPVMGAFVTGFFALVFVVLFVLFLRSFRRQP